MLFHMTVSQYSVIQIKSLNWKEFFWKRWPKIYINDLPILSDRKILFENAKEMNCDEKALGNIGSRNKFLIKFLKLALITEVTLKINFLSKTRRQSSNFNELCDRLNFLLQEKQTKRYSNIIKEETDAIANKNLEYKRISAKQHRFLLVECVN